MNEENDAPRETELQRKIRESLKRHPAKPGVSMRGPGHKIAIKHTGKLAQLKAVAAELNCSLGAVQQVEGVERARQIGQEREDQRLVALPFDVPQTADLARLVKDFPGWVFVFGKLSLLVNSYLQIARVMGETMPAAWLENLRGICENAQTRSAQDAKLKKLWPNGKPVGSGNFEECKVTEYVE